MRIIILGCLIGLFFSACNKDKYTTEPQIKYKSVDPNYVDSSTSSLTPSITFSITDAEGDIGSLTLRDTAYIHVKNLHTGDSALYEFPDLKDITKKNFKADVSVTLTGNGLFSCPVQNVLDTLYFEIYVTDYGKHKSNTIVTGDPIYNNCP
jgi:hypothetical protein